MAKETVSQAQARARNLYQRLNALSGRVLWAIHELDASASSVERGKRIAAISNALEMDNDIARRFGLGEVFPPREGPRR